MITIYCIEDINDLKYVGSTKQTLNQRLTKHRTNKKKCSSSKLNLDYCIIYPLETCDESNRKDREKYWINHTDCVNTNKLTYGDKEHMKSYRYKNRDKINKLKMRHHYYETSWGGDYRRNNNLLKIDVCLFE